MTRTKTQPAPETDEQDEHPFVVEALTNVETAKANLEQTERDLVAGSPVSPADLANAQAAVTHAELLVERARNEAVKDLRRQAHRAAVRDQIRTTAEKPDNGMQQAIDAYAEIVRIIDAVWGVAERNTDRVRTLGQQIRDTPDRRSAGLDESGTLPCVGVRTPEVVLAATPPASMVAAALLEVADRQVADPSNPAIGGNVRTGLVDLASQWRDAMQYLERGPYRGPLQTDAQIRADQVTAVRNRNRRTAELTRQAQAEAEERARERTCRAGR